jgi:protoheme IX farnesyltransferase
MGVVRDLVSLTKPKITLLNVAAALARYVASGGIPSGIPLLGPLGYGAAGGSIALNDALLIGCWVVLTLTLRNPLPFLLLTALPTALLSLETVRLLRGPDASNAWRSFKLSSPWLLLVLMGVVLSSVIA